MSGRKLRDVGKILAPFQKYTPLEGHTGGVDPATSGTTINETKSFTS